MAFKTTGLSLAEASKAASKTAAQGSSTTLVAALDPNLGEGVYLNDCTITRDPKGRKLGRQ